MIRTTLYYKAANTQASKGKDKHLLTVKQEGLNSKKLLSGLVLLMLVP